MDKARVLMVDDEKCILDCYRRSLRKHFDVRVALSGPEGLLILVADGPFTAVVSDMSLVGMNGLTFLAKVRDQSPSSRRIILSGCIDSGVFTEALKDGRVHRVLAKPCQLSLLISALSPPPSSSYT